MASSSNDKSRGFWPFITLQAQGAFSDSVFKQMLVLYAAAIVGGNDPNRLGRLTAGLLIMMPAAYLLCSCWGGFIADKFSKRLNCIYIKLLELVIMAIGFIVFLNVAGTPNPSMSIFSMAAIVLFLMYMQSAFFSPNKYGIIPELVNTRRLSWANGIVGLTTYVAIILGLAVTPELFRLWGVGSTGVSIDTQKMIIDSTPIAPSGNLHYIMFMLMILAIIGAISGLMLPKTVPANSERCIQINFLPELKRYFTIILRDRILRKTTLGVCYFWALGAVVSGHLQVWGESSLGLDIIGAGRLYWVLAAGIAAGSLLAAAISRQGTESGLIPMGALMLGIFSLPLALAEPDNRIITIISLTLFGVGGGLFIVPLNATLQEKTTIKDRGGLLAAVNYFDQTAILACMGIYLFMNSRLVMIEPNTVYLIISISTLAGTLIALKMLPETFLRLVVLLLTHMLYRTRVFGRNNIPDKGPALLVCNQVSFIDALLVMAVIRRPIRFIVQDNFSNKAIVRWGMRVLRCLPIKSAQNIQEIQRTLKSIAGELESGGLVCVFSESHMTRTSQGIPFHHGLENILEYTRTPILPVYLDGVWGSIFSFEGGQLIWKWPRSISCPVRIAIGKPQSSDIDRQALRHAINHLGTEMALVSKKDTPLLHHSLIKSCRRFPRLFMMTDQRSGEHTNMTTAMIRSIILARRLSIPWGKQKKVGILLPPSVGGAIVNYAATLSGRTSVNLNYTVGQNVMNACAKQCELKTVITSHEFLRKTGLKPPCKPVYTEDLVKRPKSVHRWIEIIGAMVALKLRTTSGIEKYCKAVQKTSPDTLATIIFSSGSTGMPKGIMLSHFNIASNIRSFRQAINLWPDERILGTLPFFHSFGYTVCLWGSAAGPFGVVYHPNPLDLKALEKIIPREKISLMITTPTFLTHYMSRFPPETFGSINGIITGAEKLTEPLRNACHDKFGIKPLQGYGATECAPAISLNVSHFRAAGFHQVGSKSESVGLSLPGLSIRILDPETNKVLPDGESGLIDVRGPNVMQGYLNMPEKTSEVLRNGWYNTGDIGHLDEDGFLFVTDRLSRFSKIGGEMIPHVTIEDKMHELLGLDDRNLVITAVPDEKKGEQLVVLTILPEEDVDILKRRMIESGLSALWIPPPKNYFRLHDIPVLGSGKIDLKKCEQTAIGLMS